MQLCVVIVRQLTYCARSANRTNSVQPSARLLCIELYVGILYASFIFYNERQPTDQLVYKQTNEYSHQQLTHPNNTVIYSTRIKHSNFLHCFLLRRFYCNCLLASQHIKLCRRAAQQSGEEFLQCGESSVDTRQKINQQQNIAIIFYFSIIRALLQHSNVRQTVELIHT